MRYLKMTATSLCLASLMLVLMGRADTSVPQLKMIQPPAKIILTPTPEKILGPIATPDPPRNPDPSPETQAGVASLLFPKPEMAAPNIAVPKPTVKPQVKTYQLAGGSYVETYWKKGGASWYDEDSVTAWANGRWSQGRWDFGQNRWVKEPRRKLYHPTWMGHTNWHRFGTYRNTVPTVAHKFHELGTFVKFRYNGRECVAMVTDRGPYIRGRDWDLNPCLKRRLGFSGVRVVEYNVLKKID